MERYNQEKCFGVSAIFWTQSFSRNNESFNIFDHFYDNNDLTYWLVWYNIVCFHGDEVILIF